MSERKYAFSWSLLGDIAAGRPNLGPTLRLEVYRLMQFCFRDVLEKRYGTDGVDDIFREAGLLAGEEYYKNIIAPTKPADFAALVSTLEVSLRNLGVGVFRVERAKLDELDFVLTVSEDLDCSGLPELGYETCVYDEGFLGGILKSYTGREFKVREVDCWCTSDRTCRFEARLVAE
ncbi:MAG: 4-vinyl reductase [Candidatus Adiutrix sp.]|nr:4-vinyl reductase [Candidatus Adiutrix sp.]